MWIFMHDAMLSIVAHRQKPGVLMVRARERGDIRRVFPKARVWSTPKADYPYRAEVARVMVTAAITARLEAIDYDNFKNAVPPDPEHDARHVAYLRVWTVMKYQPIRMESTS